MTFPSLNSTTPKASFPVTLTTGELENEESTDQRYHLTNTLITPKDTRRMPHSR